MPRLIFTQAALDDLKRLRDFLASKSPEASTRALQKIKEDLLLLLNFPESHRPVQGYPNQRERVIKFGTLGYVARYHYVQGGDVTVLRIRHQREISFK